MKIRIIFLAIVSLLCMALVSCPENVVEPTPKEDDPHIDSLFRLPLEYSKTFRIYGINFDSLKTGNRVFINDTEADSILYKYWSDTLIEMYVPSWAVNGELYVKTGNLISNKVSFTIKDQPFIYHISHNYCVSGDTILIKGHYLGDYNPDSSFVIINNNNYIPIFWNDTMISFIAPDLDGNQDSEMIIRAITGKKASKEPLRAYLLKEPIIEAISTEIAIAESSIYISGQNLTLFSRNQNDLPGLYLNGAKIEKLDFIDNTKIKFTLPTGAKSGNIFVKRFGMQSNSVYLKIIGKPLIESITPSEGKEGDEIVITGKNFTENIGKVLFNDKLAAIVMWSDNRIICKTPDINHNLDVYVDVDGYKSNGVMFRFPDSKTLNHYKFKYVDVKSFMYPLYTDTLIYNNGKYKFKLRPIFTDRDSSDCYVVFDSLTMYLKEASISYAFIEVGAGGLVSYYKKTVYTITAKDIPVARMDDVSVDYLISKINADRIKITYVISGGWKNNKTGESGYYDEKGVVDSNSISDYEFHFY